MWKKQYAQALPLAALNYSSPKNYVIQNVNSGKRPGSDALVLSLLGGRYLGVSSWRGEPAPDKMFSIEPCSDTGGVDCVISAYGGSSSTKLQVVFLPGSNSLEVRAYPTGNEERLRPPLKQWRFSFEEVGPPGLKKYRIRCMDEELGGANCLYLSPSQGLVITKFKGLLNIIYF